VIDQAKLKARALLVLTAAAFIGLGAGNSGFAATIVVTGTGDTIAVDGLVTLREAMASVNAGANVNADVVAVGAYGSSDTINFAIPGPAFIRSWPAARCRQSRTR
jgi:hypothetical protein